MIYYPLATLMLAGIRDILIITTSRDLPQYKALLKDGAHWRFKINYAVQSGPDELAQAFIIGEEFIGSDSVSLILGDNIFHEIGLQSILMHVRTELNGACVFELYVRDPERYGVVEFNDQGTVIGVEEKPNEPKSNHAITGLYFL